MTAPDPSKGAATAIQIPQGSQSGQAMDRVVKKKRFAVPQLLGAIAVLTVLGLSGYLLWNQSQHRSFSVANNRVTVSEVVAGSFEDLIPIRARVTPRKTVYLDVIEGGQVQQRLVDDGVLVQAGDLLVKLNNTSLQLDVTRNEALATEQLNDMRTIELQLEQNRLSHKRNLVEMNYQIKRLQRQVERFTNLDDAGLAIRSQLENADDELQYYQNLREVTLESQRTDAVLQETQLKFLKISATQLEKNLGLTRSNLDALNVRAPVSGKLSGFDIEVGQSIQRGGRLGQIDDPSSFKLRVEIDEFYLGRVDLGQQAHFERAGDDYQLVLNKIYPQVNNGQFVVDLLFQGDAPKDIRRGQTLQATLTLGDATQSLIIPNGSFFQDTGGNWIFVVKDNEAVRRPVRLGRRNSKYIEVLDGLEAGERVVTSPYSSFKSIDRLVLTEH